MRIRTHGGGYIRERTGKAGGKMQESILEKKFRAMVAQAGGKAYKFVSPGNAGVPDRLVILPGGKIGFVELKQKGRKPGRQQEYRIAELELLGCFATVVDDDASAEAAIGNIRAQRDTDNVFREMVNRAPHGGGK